MDSWLSELDLLFHILIQGLFHLCRRAYSEVLKDFFENKLLMCQNLLSTEERYEKILEMIPDGGTYFYFSVIPSGEPCYDIPALIHV